MLDAVDQAVEGWEGAEAYTTLLLLLGLVHCARVAEGGCGFFWRGVVEWGGAGRGWEERGGIGLAGWAGGGSVGGWLGGIVWWCWEAGLGLRDGRIGFRECGSGERGISVTGA